MNKINIIIADTQYLITESLKIFLDKDEKFNLIEISNSYSQLIHTLDNNSISLLITDIATFDYPKIHSLEEIKNNYPNLKILILTNQLIKSDFNELNLIGIKNIIYKTIDKAELSIAIQTTLIGKKYYSDEVFELLLEEEVKTNNIKGTAQLTVTENEIVKLIAEGLTTKEIAAEKHISFHTVMTHRKNIFRKLNVNSSSELILYAIKSGWIDNIEYFI